MVELVDEGGQEGTAPQVGGKQGKREVTESRSMKTQTAEHPWVWGPWKSSAGCFGESTFRGGVWLRRGLKSEREVRKYTAVYS